MTEDERQGRPVLATLRDGITLRDRRVRIGVLSILGPLTVGLLVMAPIFETLGAGVAVGVATAVFLLVVLVEYGAQMETQVGALKEQVRGVGQTLSAQDERLTGIHDHVAEVAERERLLVFRNEADAMRRQEEFVRGNRLSSVKLCEYSTASVEPLLGCLADREGLKSIQLLLGRPAPARPYQTADRLRPALVRLALQFPVQTARARGLEIKCYSEPPSMRGRKFGDQLIVMGWYTYHRRQKKWARDQIWGDVNALVWTPCVREEWPAMRDMFEEVFNTLWETAEPLEAAWAPFLAAGLRDQHPEFPEDDWLAAVSR
jgi:hypothetical protein